MRHLAELGERAQARLGEMKRPEVAEGRDVTNDARRKALARGLG